MQTATPATLLEFWFGDGATDWPSAALTKRWFNATRRDDRVMAETFGDAVDAALVGGLKNWEAQAASRLALILLLDQLPRNIFRGSERAFAGDARAAKLVLDGVAAAMERQLAWAQQVFFYMPLMHAEDVAMQRRCVECFSELKQRIPEALKPRIDQNLRFAREHLDVIERFGRFPHRNAALGRVSSAAELAYLETANRYGQ